MMLPRQNKNFPNPDFAECYLCRERVPPDDASMMLHLINNHPLELLASPSARNVLARASNLIENFFQGIGEKIREASKNGS